MRKKVFTSLLLVSVVLLLAGFVNSQGTPPPSPDEEILVRPTYKKTVRIPFDEPADSAKYIFIYFLCSVITALSCFGICWTEYQHRVRLRKASDWDPDPGSEEEDPENPEDLEDPKRRAQQAHPGEEGTPQPVLWTNALGASAAAIKTDSPRDEGSPGFEHVDARSPSTMMKEHVEVRPASFYPYQNSPNNKTGGLIPPASSYSSLRANDSATGLTAHVLREYSESSSSSSSSDHATATSSSSIKAAKTYIKRKFSGVASPIKRSGLSSPNKDDPRSATARMRKRQSGVTASVPVPSPRSQGPSPPPSDYSLGLSSPEISSRTDLTPDAAMMSGGSLTQGIGRGGRQRGGGGGQDMNSSDSDTFVDVPALGLKHQNSVTDSTMFADSTLFAFPTSASDLTEDEDDFYDAKMELRTTPERRFRRPESGSLYANPPEMRMSSELGQIDLLFDPHEDPEPYSMPRPDPQATPHERTPKPSSKHKRNSSQASDSTTFTALSGPKGFGSVMSQGQSSQAQGFGSTIFGSALGPRAASSAGEGSNVGTGRRGSQEYSESLATYSEVDTLLSTGGEGRQATAEELALLQYTTDDGTTDDEASPEGVNLTERTSTDEKTSLLKRP